MKGAMSEAELFVLRARLQGGIRNCARRGALKLTLPIGLCYSESDTVVLDPDWAACKPPLVRSYASLSIPDRLLRPFATYRRAPPALSAAGPMRTPESEKSSGETFSI